MKVFRGLNKLDYNFRFMQKSQVDLEIVCTFVPIFQNENFHQETGGIKHPRQRQPISTIISFPAKNRKGTVLKTAVYKPVKTFRGSPFHKIQRSNLLVQNRVVIPLSYLFRRQNFHL